MNSNYPAKYSDRNGEEVTTIRNDGKELRIRIRNVEFLGDDFDSFEPVVYEDVSQLASFSFYPVTVLTRGDRNNPDQSRDTQMLCDYLLTCEIPVPVVVDAKVIQGEIRIRLDFRDLDDKGEKNGNDLQIELIYEENKIKSVGQHRDFESGLISIQRVLPQNVYIKSCINCVYSDFGPHQGMFGTLGCYRGNKEEYRKIKNKRVPGKKWELLKIITEPVQETYLCVEFEPVERS